jgi:hypothetical protein
MKIRISDQIMMVDIDDEAVILNTENEQYFGLNSTALSMWKALTTTPTVEAACEKLLEEYQVDADTLQNDIHNLIDQLVDRGIIKGIDDA